LHGGEPLSADHRRADVGDDIIRVGDERVAQEGDDALYATSGDEDEANVRVLTQRRVERAAVGLAAAEECAIKIGRK
jgi:hypothetical protein